METVKIELTHLEIDHLRMVTDSIEIDSENPGADVFHLLQQSVTAKLEVAHDKITA